ncbi:cysteine/serine-rich nuclear protein 3 [Mixophyes fleayi]|uniref:cysteine/serine-rich nuclear protein 3 n=1 Tax=Mixophyes fleayi TaxID=3061075 RepID=UPI003F4E2E41
MSGILKRKFEEVDGSSPCSSVQESDDDVSSSESADSSDSVNPSSSSHFTPSSILKREKRLRDKNVRFNCVTVYYFTRRQGFTSVPSQGGSTLGMSSRHNSIRQYTLGEFALEQDRLHKEMLRDHLREEKLNSLKQKITKNGTIESEEANILTLDDISDDDIDLDNTEVDEYFFLQPLPTKKRRALLRASGVKKIDVEEKHELRAIRLSREDCGCDCRIFCDPETCTCSLAGIKCQVDRMSFPCGCSKEGCSNTAGRIEFNPIRVRTHFLHTIMKLELEKNREQQMSAANGCHSEVGSIANSMVQSGHPVEYSIAENFDIETDHQSAMMHFQTSEHLDYNGEDEEEDDGSSYCSGVTDSSTQSLAQSESDDDDDAEEDDDDDEDDCDKSDDFNDVPHADNLPVPSVLCYSDANVMHENHLKNAAYYANPSALYYQIDHHNSGATNQIPEAYSERDSVKTGAQSLVPYNMRPDQFVDYSRQSGDGYTNSHYTTTSPSVIVCCATSENDNNGNCNSLYTEHRSSLPPGGFCSYLKSPSSEGYVSSLNGVSHHVPELLNENAITLSETSKLHEDCMKSPVVETVPV